MSKKIHVTDKAPSPVGPYSQAVEINSTVYLSGQIPIDPKNGEVFRGDIQKQTQMVMDNIGNVLTAADLNFDNVIKCGIFLTDLNDFSAVNEIYGTFFGDKPPARSCVQVAALPKDVNVEIEVIAVRS